MQDTCGFQHFYGANSSLQKSAARTAVLHYVVLTVKFARQAIGLTFYLSFSPSLPRSLFLTLIRVLYIYNPRCRVECLLFEIFNKAMRKNGLTWKRRLTTLRKYTCMKIYHHHYNEISFFTNVRFTVYETLVRVLRKYSLERTACVEGRAPSRCLYIVSGLNSFWKIVAHSREANFCLTAIKLGLTFLQIILPFAPSREYE